MILKAKIKPELWSAVAHSYEAENYASAIKDAMFVITQVLRDKSGLDGDGVELVGPALGFGKGNQPRIKINKLQTETERNEQMGLMFTLRGMYQLVRNPRVHERVSDTKQTADAIIYFIDHLLNYLDASSQTFTVQDFIRRVRDPHFVDDFEYVRDLVDTIPMNKKADTLIALHRLANWKQSDTIRVVIREIIDRLSDEEVDDFIAVVSDDLQEADHPSDISLRIKVVPNELWPKVKRISRLRAENMLLEELKKAYYEANATKPSTFAPAWASHISPYLLRKRKWRRVIIEKLENKDFDHHNFVANYLLNSLPNIFVREEEVSTCVNALAESVRAGNKVVKDALVDHLRDCYLVGTIDEDGPSEWCKQIVESLQDLTDSENPELHLPDGTPFLGKFEEKHNLAIPF